MNAAGADEVRIWLWDAGPWSGTAGSAERAMEMAGEYLGAGVTAVAEEALLVVSGGRRGGLASVHQRTGWRMTGHLVGGVPVWEPDAARAG